MTNDEAITNLNMIRVAFVEPVTKEQRKLIDDTFEMAIKALEQQPNRDKNPCETCGYVEGSPFCLQYCPYDAERKKEQQPCEMTVEEYRQRMIQAFHNADTDELIAVCVLPTEKEFEHLEWLLKNHYKKAPCDDAISRQAVLNILFYKSDNNSEVRLSKELRDRIKNLPPVTPQQKYGKWIYTGDYLTEGMLKCSECGEEIDVSESYYDFCPVCGAKMQERSDKE